MHRAGHGCGAASGQVSGVELMEGRPVFSGLAVLAFAVYMGLSEIAMAIGKRRFDVHEVRLNGHVTLVKDDHGTPP